jgi:hypothetical protein
MAFTISVLILLAALFVILHRGYGDAEQKWAFSVVGTVAGAWLGKCL